jgi:hypothetical protein
MVLWWPDGARRADSGANCPVSKRLMTTPTIAAEKGEYALSRRKRFAVMVFEFVHSLLIWLDDYFAPGYDPY